MLSLKFIGDRCRSGCGSGSVEARNCGTNNETLEGYGMEEGISAIEGCAIRQDRILVVERCGIGGKIAAVEGYGNGVEIGEVEGCSIGVEIGAVEGCGLGGEIGSVEECCLGGEIGAVEVCSDEDDGDEISNGMTLNF